MAAARDALTSDTVATRALSRGFARSADRPSRRKVVTRDDRQSLDQFRRVSLTRDDRHIAVVTDDVEGNLWTIRDR